MLGLSGCLVKRVWTGSSPNRFRKTWCHQTSCAISKFIIICLPACYWNNPKEPKIVTKRNPCMSCWWLCMNLALDLLAHATHPASVGRTERSISVQVQFIPSAKTRAQLADKVSRSFYIDLLNGKEMKRTLVLSSLNPVGSTWFKFRWGTAGTTALAAIMPLLRRKHPSWLSMKPKRDCRVLIKGSEAKRMARARMEHVRSVAVATNKAALCRIESLLYSR